MTAIDPNHVAELAADLGAIQRDLEAWSSAVDLELAAVQAQVANLPVTGADAAMQGQIANLLTEVQRLGAVPVPSAYDDTALAGRVAALESAPAHDDGDLAARVDGLAAELGGMTPYDDSDIRQTVETNRVAAADSLVALDARVAAVEARPEAVPYDDSGLVGRIGAQEAAYGTLSPRVDGAATQAYKASTSATAALTAVQAIETQVATAAKATDLTAALTRIAALEAAVKAFAPTPAPPVPVWDPTDLAHPFAATSAWNATVPASATYKTIGVDLSSTAAGGAPWAEGNSPLSSAPPVWIGKATDPVWSCYDPHYKVTRTFHAPDGMYPMTGPDHAAVVYDTTTGIVWSLFAWTSTDAAHRTIGLDPSSGGTESCKITDTGWATKDAAGNITKAGVRAAGSSMLGGMVWGPDFAKGRCDHALGIVIARAFQQPGPVDPALSQDQGAVGTYTGGTSAPHEGSWLAIPRTTVPLNLTAEQQVIWRCLQEHGGYVVDSNKGFSICLEPTTTTLAQLTSVNSNGFMATVAKALRFVVPTATADPYMGVGYGGPY